MKTSLLLATVLWTSSAAAPTNSFNAIIKAHARQAIAGTSGIATFNVENDAVRYDVKVAALQQITDVVLLTGRTAIKLYSGAATDRETLEAGGVLTATDLQGLTVAEVKAAMESGKAQVVVFTLKYADGSISGKVVPLPDETETPDAPAPKVTASTT